MRGMKSEGWFQDSISIAVDFALDDISSEDMASYISGDKAMRVRFVEDVGTVVDFIDIKG